MQLQLELLRREKDVAEREAELAKRELDFIRRTQAGPNLQSARGTTASAAPQLPQVSPTISAERLNLYDGTEGAFESWSRQFRLLRNAHGLREEACLDLIVSRLRGKALEWFHSKADHVEMTTETLLEHMGAMFHQRPSRHEARRRFEERMWQRGETFAEYLHQKTILANRTTVDEEEFIDCALDGIPDPALRDQARLHCFGTREDLLKAFRKITLRGKTTCTASKEGAAPSPSQKEGNESRSLARRCTNCGDQGHQANKCPSQSRGRKCFNCNAYGHISRECPQKITAKNVLTVAASTASTFRKDVRVNGYAAVAVLDTGSEVSLIRENVYRDIGAPPLEKEELRLRGIGTQEHETIGKFAAEITIDGEIREITLRVVRDTVLGYGILLGADFINASEWVVGRGAMTLTKREARPGPPEILYLTHEPACDTVDLSHVTDPKIRREVETVVREYCPSSRREVGVEMKILLKDDEPVYQRPRRLSPSERDEVNRQISEWIRDGIAQPSLSEYASPVVLVKKKDGKTRLCVDYRQLNTKIIRDRYPLPLIEDQLDQLQGATIYSTIDLRNAFFHVSIEPESRKYTAFIVPDGHYEFLKVPFGLCNSPSVFQRFVNVAFRDLIAKKTVLTYMDDLVVPAANYEDGARRLRTVLERAADCGLAINWTKCELLRTRVEYLGHIVEAGAIRPSENKTRAVARFPQPTNIKQVQSFLGLSGYFRKFVAGYSAMARPLTRLLKSDVSFRFGEEERHAFQSLQEALLQGPVLQLYRPERETELHTDASMLGYGAILLQRDSEDGTFHPVYYASGATTAAEQKYPSYELEVLAIVRALRKFRVYLLGVPFRIVTDCRAFALTMRKKDLCVRVARWALLLEEFEYEIEHRPGSAMRHVDALSRNPASTCLAIESEDSVTARIRKAQERDDDLRKIINGIDEQRIDGYVLRRGLLMREMDGDFRIVVPKAMQTQVVRRAHESGHFATAKTEAQLRRDYWFPAMRAKIRKVIENCVECILAERKQGQQEGLLHPIYKGDRPLDTYHVDHLGPLPSTRKQYRYIFVVVDGFAKFVWLYATKTTNTAEVIERLRKQAEIFGNPRRIISDRGTAFTSQAFKDYCNEEGIGHTLIVTGVPRGNGQVERVNRTLIPVLTKLSAPRPEEWYKHLPKAQVALNAAQHRSTGTSPFTLLFGTQMHLRDDPQAKELIEAELRDMFQTDRDETRQRAKEQLQRVQQENRRLYDRRRRQATTYSEGDLVAIRRTQFGPGLKLAGKFMGPYEVARVLRNDRYLVVKVGEHEGPRQTSTAAEYMKRWINEDDEDEEIGEQDEEDNSDDEDVRGRTSIKDGRV